MNLQQLTLVLYYCINLVISLPTESPTILTQIKTNKLLADCENNVFLDENINVGLKNCSIYGNTSSRYDIKQLRCLMMYDINLRLCKLLKNDHSVTMNEGLFDHLYKANKTSTAVCNSLSGVSYEELPGYPGYVDELKDILSSPIKCQLLCSTDIDLDAHIFCKIFSWINDKLIRTKNSNPPEGHPALETSKAHEEEKTHTPNIIDEKPEDVLTKEINKKDSNTNAVEISTKSKDISSSAQKVPVGETVSTADLSQQNSPSIVPKVSSVKNVDNTHKITPTGNDNDSIQDKPIPSELDYDSDIVGDDEFKNDDMDINPIADSTKKGVDDKIKTAEQTKLLPIEKQEDSVHSSIGNIDSSINKYPYENLQQFPQSMEIVNEDDGSMFPFMLTVFAIVVVLYIIYHNKNKFSKLVMGLLVEGRQNGSRRRNSRGHQYRRLDTLEQAMSSSAQTPPSKIIY